MRRAARAALAPLAVAAAVALAATVGAGCAGEKAAGRPWVHDVRWEGVHAVKPKAIAERVAVEETPLFSFGRKRYLDPFTLELDRARIEAFYRAHGYFDARVTRAEAVPRDDERTSVDVLFAVEEGAPTRIAAVRLDGIDGLPEPERRRLEGIVARRLRPGEVLVHARYVEAKERLKEKLLDAGRAFATVEGRVEVDRDARVARIVLSAAPGPIARFAHVHVFGTERVDPRRVAIRTGLREGDRFDPAALDTARGRLWNLGVFSSVAVRFEPKEGDPAQVDVLVTVREGRRNELRLGLGLGFESQRTDVHASAIYTRYNFLGGLRTLRLRIEPGVAAVPAFWNVQRIGPAGNAEAQLTQPDVPWRESELTALVGYDVFLEYAYQAHGPRTQLGWSQAFWSRRLQVQARYGFQYLDFFNTDPTILADPALAGQLYGFVDPYRLGWVGEDAIVDLRDRPLAPRRGAYFALSAEQGGVYTGSQFTYEKVSPDARVYLPIGRRVVLAARAQLGWIWTQGEFGSPITRRFYLGGPSSHRGFNYNRLSQQVPSGLPGVAPIPIGGDQMALFQAEVRADLFRIGGNWLSLVAFFDAGDVAAPACGIASCPTNLGRTTIDFGDLHLAAGGGLRLRTVIGTVRFDVGARLNRLGPVEPDGTPNPDPGQRVAVHLSLGEAF
jgi:translocation and assembly module TamA